jgi:phosphoglycolate phosphatase-like HAD superfamily hydrolase
MLTKYKTLLFDCDGVVLNSNEVKTSAFYNTALPYGVDAAQALVNYHVNQGGISRYKKFEWFIKNVVDESHVPDFEKLLNMYASEVRQGLLNCEVVNGLVQIRHKFRDTNWMIVSGGDQKELREVFEKRELLKLFDGGIYGSPASKHDILSREISNGTIRKPAVFFGDSKYDFEVAQEADIDFIFVSGWSEWKESDLFIRKFTNKINFLSDYL